MVRKPKITSLAELRQRKKEVRLENELVKRELAHSMGTSRENLSSFLLKKVAAPAGGATLALVALNKFLGSSGKTREIVRETKVIHEYPDQVPGPQGQGAVAPRPMRIAPRRRSRLKGISTVVGLGKLIIPIVQAIIGAMSAHSAQESADEAKQAAT